METIDEAIQHCIELAQFDEPEFNDINTGATAVPTSFEYRSYIDSCGVIVTRVTNYSCNGVSVVGERALFLIDRETMEINEI